ncbi:MAG: hypothetical protein JWR26_1158 [Pedosphaera sp.]|nr:hypothetical protein [Pedosphaera sp.]
MKMLFLTQSRRGAETQRKAGQNLFFCSSASARPCLNPVTNQHKIKTMKRILTTIGLLLINFHWLQITAFAQPAGVPTPGTYGVTLSSTNGALLGYSTHLFENNMGLWQTAATTSSIPAARLTGTLPNAVFPAAGGDLTGSYPSPTLVAVGTAGTYGQVTTDAKGRVTAGTTTDISHGGTGATSKAGAAANIGTQFVPGTDVIIGSGIAPAYQGQIAITHDQYWYWGNSTTAGDWKAAANFLDGMNIGDSIAMSYAPGGANPYQDYINGNLQNQTNAQAGNGNRSYFNMNPWGYSGITMAYVTAGATPTSPSVVSDAVAGTLFTGGSKAAEGIKGVCGIAVNPPLMFGVLVPYNLGGETSFNHLTMAYDIPSFVWHWPKPTSNVCNPTNAANIDAMKLEVKTGDLNLYHDLFLRGTIYAGGTTTNQQTYAITTPDGHLQLGAADPTQTLKLAKIIPNSYTTAGQPMVDVGNNGTGLFFPFADPVMHFACAGVDRGKIDASGNLIAFIGESIGTPNAPAACALLDLVSTSQGLLLPRMTKTQRDAISSKVAGLVIYQTDNAPGLRVYNGTSWMRYTETAD